MLKSFKMRIKRCIMGIALADAMGAYLEYRSKPTVTNYFKNTPYVFPPEVDLNHMIHRGEQPCHWTDDTSQVILLMDMLIENNGEIDTCLFARKLVEWLEKGIPECNETNANDVGGLTLCVIKGTDFTTNPKKSAFLRWVERARGAASNGSVMRTAVMGGRNVAYNKAIADAIEIGMVTHYDPRCSVACAVITSLVWDIIHETPEDQTLRNAYNWCTLGGDYTNECCVLFNVHTLEELKLDDMIGYALKCMAVGVWAYRNRYRPYRDVIIDIIMEGGDTDTNAAVAGGVLGAWNGYDNLPLVLLCMNYFYI